MRSYVASATLLAALSSLLSCALAANEDVWAYAPDFSKDPFPPYPPLKNPDGTNISTANLRGTRLYGWKGCGRSESNLIAEAFDDFYKLASPLSSTLDWSDTPAQDFWGKNEGPNKVPDDRRTQIQQIFKAQQQMYAYGWHLPLPGLAWRILWIEVRCSTGDKKTTGDPGDFCKDLLPDDGQCPRGGLPLGEDQDNHIEAFSESPTVNKALWYSRITFCNRFFNKLPSLSEAIKWGKKKSKADQQKLETWNSRARCFLHETTHLDYFMNSPGSSPLVDDLSIKYKQGGGLTEEEAYGPYNCKILRNYGLKGEVAFYPQRNADSFAWFATGVYVQKKVGKYPMNPRPNLVPVEDPKNSGGGDVRAADADPADLKGQPPADVVPDSNDDPPDYAQGYSFPGCPDNGMKSSQANDGKPSAQGGSDPVPKADPKCDTNALSGIPYNVFYGSSFGSSDVFGKFCDAVDAAQDKALSWTTDASGNQKKSSRRLMRRTPPPDPSAYSSFSFDLKFEPSSPAGSCSQSCHDAFVDMAESQCGQQGGEQNEMTAEATLDVACGTYSYKITGKDVPAPAGPPKPKLSAQYCFPSNAFGDHGDIQEFWQSIWIGSVCGGSAAETIKKDDPSTYRNFHTVTGGVPYNYTISWEPDCNSDVTEMNINKPLDNDSDVTCVHMMQNNYRNCNNGGIGGSISVGCVIYEFKASLNGSP